MAKVYSSGQFLTGNLQHFTLTKTGLAASDFQHIVDTAQARATTVLIGAISGTSVRIAVENNVAWNDDAVADDPASLSLALGSGWAVADFIY